MPPTHPTSSRSNASTRRCAAAAVLLAWTLIWNGCSTMTLPQPDLSSSAWHKRSGQVVWTAKRGGVELVADVNAWVAQDGRCWLEVNKSGLPFLTVQLERDAWRIESASTARAYSGHGEPPARIGWAQLAAFLSGRNTCKDWTRHANGEDIQLEHTRTGERIAGFLSR